MALPPTEQLSRPGGRVLRYCLYGPADGVPVISHSGSPSSRWKRPRLLSAMAQSKLRLLVYDRPGYGGSTRMPGRRVADVTEDVEALADALGWPRFGVFGGSGGGPHALACAARLGDRVTRCAVLSGIKPDEAGERVRDEPEVRASLAGVAAGILARIEAGGPEAPDEPGSVARDDPDAMARIRATFVDSMDGWTDDFLSFARPWGFEPGQIEAPVAIWRGSRDAAVPAGHAEWMLAHIRTARGHVYDGEHLPGPDVYAEVFDWLAAG